MKRLLVCAVAFVSVYAQDHWVTIFMHGGGAHPLYLNLSDAFKIINDNIKYSVYERTTASLRQDPYFFQVQPQQGEGLKKAFGDGVIFDQHNGAHLFGLMYDTISKKVGFPTSDLYSYGWTGLLSINARRAAAKKLYRELAFLADKIRKQGDTPRFRLIAYSHSGNMSLHLTEEYYARGYQSFVVDEFIMLATPIQINTERYLTSPLFKKVFLFYSIGDNIQSSDFLSSPTHSFTHRVFSETKSIKIPAHVTQVQVRFWRKHITAIKKDGSRYIIHRHEMIHPNHTEMFFFGWTPEWFRKHFPITPLPAALLMPYFLHTIRENHLEGDNLRLTIIPDDERAVILDKKTNHTFEIPFFDKKTFYALRNQLWHYRPQNMNEYRDRMKAHWRAAQKDENERVRQKKLSQQQMRMQKKAALKKQIAAKKPKSAL